jgi:arabinose-5-phosphate isomerase
MEENDTKQIIDDAKTVLKIESESILGLTEKIDHQFAVMVSLIFESKGRVIVGGIGKSGIIARKIVATLNSTGTRSLFLHPVEAMHGDLGMVCQDDIFIALSSSGETDELNILLSSIRTIGCTIIAFTGNPASTLAQHSQMVIDVGVKQEACPLGLAPTSSTAAMMAMGDALAVALINQRHFKSDDFKRYHPGGALGQRLARKVADIMMTEEAVPLIGTGAPMVEAIRVMDLHSLGVILVGTAENTLAGIITDGDIRRAIARQIPVLELAVDALMTESPYQFPPDAPAYDALNMMEQYQITVLPITDASNKIKGILHLHDILGKGEFKFNGR